MCKLSYVGECSRTDVGYILYLDDVLATELPLAPTIAKENLNTVYRSEELEFIGETITRVTWIVFLFGLRATFTAEHSKRMQKSSL